MEQQRDLKTLEETRDKKALQRRYINYIRDISAMLNSWCDNNDNSNHDDDDDS
jgi:hypothetical protein